MELFSFVSGVALGVLVGLAGGLRWYVKYRQSEKARKLIYEQAYQLGLERNQYMELYAAYKAFHRDTELVVNSD